MVRYIRAVGIGRERLAAQGWRRIDVCNVRGSTSEPPVVGGVEEARRAEVGNQVLILRVRSGADDHFVRVGIYYQAGSSTVQQKTRGDGIGKIPPDVIYGPADLVRAAGECIDPADKRAA